MRKCVKYFLGLTIFASSVFINTATADLKIGFLGDFTGSYESVTPSVLEAVKLAATHINEQGGVLSGQRLNVFEGDTHCDNAVTATKAARQLVEEAKVTAIVGALCSRATIAAAKEVTIPAGVVMVSPASTSHALSTLADNDLVFRTVATSSNFQSGVMARLLISKGIKNIAITYVANDYGLGFSRALTSAFTKAGGKITASKSHKSGKSSYRDEIESLASSGANTLVVLAHAESSGKTIIREALQSKRFFNLAGGDGMASEELLDDVRSSALRYMIITKPTGSNTLGANAFVELASDADFDHAAMHAAHSYDAAFLLALAVEKNGSTKREELSAALRSVATAPGEIILPGEWKKAAELIAAGKAVNYQGASGNHEFSSTGDVSGAIVQMGFRKGKLVELGIVD